MPPSQAHETSGLLHSHSTAFTTSVARDENNELNRRYSTMNDASANEANSTAFSSILDRSMFFFGWQGSKSASIDPSTVDESKRDRAARRATPAASKLGTYDGVFVPTTLNVLSVLMFIRFGFIIGQAGVLGVAAMLVIAYFVNLITTMSVSAIATNGTVRGGGTYYMISRSLGPEFGGSIGIVFYLGTVFSAGLNAVGLVDCFAQTFGVSRGTWYNWLPDDLWSAYLWSTLVLLLCTAICLAGSAMFARCSNVLLVILLIATYSIPVSMLLVRPFQDAATGVEYTGPQMKTLINNLEPRFTRGALGSVIHGRENFSNMFGILFSATGGIFAGASMSGDLRKPSKSIPKGTMFGLLLTFFTYALVVLSLGLTVTRASFYRNLNVVQEINLSGTLILVGEFATSFFSSLMGVIGAAKLLQALARDNLIPGLTLFGQGTRLKDEPVYAIIVTHLIGQVTMLFDINVIASFITMAYLMTFLVTNLACFFLKISSAPNFRPSFQYFNWQTALLGSIASGALMFFVDGLYATSCIGLLVALFAVIHYTASPKAWGDVSQALIYHSVRKYLLRLRQEHVKFWRPQILLFVNDPRRSYKLIQFCNSLKKGSLFILGHVIVSHDFAGSVPEARKQQQAWTKYIDFSKIKAFISVAISPGLEWGTRNIVLGAGLGSMRPNIIVTGFYNLKEYRTGQTCHECASTPVRSSQQQSHSVRKHRKHEETMHGHLPTDENRLEKAVGPQDYVTMIEDMILRLKVNMALAIGFDELELPARKDSRYTMLKSYLTSQGYQAEENSRRYIDLWPIQMSADIAAEGAGDERNVHTTNFDTYTLILQLGCILTTVPSWKRAYTLRVAVFVEYESDVEEERGRVEALLSNLRIEAEVMVFWLASGDLSSYEIIVNGATDIDDDMYNTVEATLSDDEWRHEIKQARADASSDLFPTTSHRSDAFSLASGISSNVERFERLGRLLHRRSQRSSLAHLNRLGVNPTMQTHRLDQRLVDRATAVVSASTSSDEDEDSSSSATDSEADFADSEGDRSSQSAASENDRERYAFSDDPVDEAPPYIPRRSTLPTLAPESSGSASRPTSRPTSRLSAYADPSSGDDRPSSRRRMRRRGDVEQSIAEQTSSSSKPSSLNPSSSEPQHEQTAPTPSSVSSKRPQTTRHKSYPRLTSSLMPRATLATEESQTGGPSIMFSTPSPPSRNASNPLHSIYARNLRNVSEGRNGKRSTSQMSRMSRTSQVSAQAQTLSFNSLPSRAQYLILNELIGLHSGGFAGRGYRYRESYGGGYHGVAANGGYNQHQQQQQQASETAVIFTTLPPPTAGTGNDEAESLRYLVDLETLTGGLPPVLMVHSSSISVTVDL